MALQTTGAITLSEIQTGFGGVNPIGMDEYYRGGSIVPDAGTLNPNIPTSGAISMSNFYGAKVLTTGSYTMNSIDGSTGTFSIYKGPTSTFSYRGYHSTLNQIYRPNSPSSPSENSWGGVSGSSFTTHNATILARSVYSVYEERSDGYRSVYHVFSARGSTSAYPPNNDATFRYVTFPVLGSSFYGIPTTRVNFRFQANTVSNYIVSGIYYTRWTWLVDAGYGGTTIPASYILQFGNPINYSLTYYA
jgi:hypothetical protein